MPLQDIRVDTPDGHALSARVYLPVQAPRRVVLLAGAMGVPQRFYEPFAQWLSEQGLAVLTFDWRGTGASAPRRMRGFKASITDWAMQDLPALIDELNKRWPDVPATYLGHSLGGQVFGWLDQAHRFDRVLTVASGNGYWRFNAPGTRFRAPFLWWLLAPVGIGLMGYFPGKRLGVVGDLPAGAMWQWRRWCLHPDYLGMEGAALRQRYAAIKVPITAVVMVDDELLSPHGIRDLYRLYSGAQVRFESIEPHRVGLKRVGHFGLFKPNSASTLWPLALQWIEA
jgi:predicted alpha/beta hydrolase